MQIWRRQTHSFSELGPAKGTCTTNTYLFIKLDESGFVLLLVVIANVAWVLHVGQTFAHVGLLWHEHLLHLSGQGVEWNFDILGISDLFEFNVGDFLVAHDCGVVGWHIAWEFGEIGSHIVDRKMQVIL